MPTLTNSDRGFLFGAGVDDLVLEELCEAFEGGDLVLFAGSGIPAAAGLPTWKALVESITELVRESTRDAGVVEELTELARAQRYLEALSAARHALGPEDFCDFVARNLDDTGVEPPPLAHAVAALRHKLRAALTTSLDGVLERAFGDGWRVLVSVSDEVSTSRRFILKVRGTLREHATWIFTPDSLRTLAAAPSQARALAELFGTCPVLFVGFGFADGTFEQLLGEVRALAGARPPSHFALVPSRSVTPFRRSQLEELGLRLVAYDDPDGQHAQAFDLLSRLGASARADLRGASGLLLPPEPVEGGAPLGFVESLDSARATLPGLPPDLGRHSRWSEPPVSPVEVFFSYSHKNRDLRDKLEKHLAILKRKGIIRGWHDGQIGAGEERDRELSKHLEAANVILLLVSADYLASDFCYDIEMRKALERHLAGEARVIPILLDACDWEGAPFGKLKLESLPRGQRPVTSWPNQSEAFTDIAKGIRAEVEKLTQNPS